MLSSNKALMTGCDRLKFLALGNSCCFRRQESKNPSPDLMESISCSSLLFFGGCGNNSRPAEHQPIPRHPCLCHCLHVGVFLPNSWIWHLSQKSYSLELATWTLDLAATGKGLTFKALSHLESNCIMEHDSGIAWRSSRHVGRSMKSRQ